jgi:hypothetical protein
MTMNRRKGVAIAVVLVFCTAILGLLTVLMMNSRHQRGSHSMQYDQTRALMAARSGIQLAIYKYRVLPSEYYRIHQMAMDIKNGGGNPAEFNATREMWLRDFRSESPDTPAARIKAHLDAGVSILPGDPPAGSYEFAVEEFDLISRSLAGYTQDYLRVRAWGSFRGTRKTMEELIEVKIAE